MHQPVYMLSLFEELETNLKHSFILEAHMREFLRGLALACGVTKDLSI
jgi:hypothetical protein